MAPEPSSALIPTFRRLSAISAHNGDRVDDTLPFFLRDELHPGLGYLFKVSWPVLWTLVGLESCPGMTLVAFLSLFDSLGLPRSASRYVAAYCATGKFDLLARIFGRRLLALWLSTSCSGVMLLVGPWIAVHFYDTPEIQAYLPLFALLMIAEVLTSFFGQVLAAYRNVARRTVISNFIGSPATMILTVVLVTGGFGLGGYIFANGRSLPVLALLVRMAWRLTPRAARFFSGTLPGMEKEAVAFSATSVGLGLLDFLKVQTDRIAVGHYLDARQLGVSSDRRGDGGDGAFSAEIDKPDIRFDDR